MGRKNSKKKTGTKQRHSGERILKGTLDITRSGMGFVTVEGMDVDVLIRPADFNTALHGDTVRVTIKEVRSDGKRMQGVVKDVLVRKRTEFIGHLQMNKGFAFFVAEMDKPMPDIYVPLQNFNNAKDGDRVVVRLTQWDREGKRPVGEVIAVMDPENSNDAAMKEILLGGGFPLQFPDEVMEEAARIPDIISTDEIAKRKLIEQINWINNKIDEKNPNPYKNIDGASLLQMPTNNLNIMVDQLTNIYKIDRLNHEIDDIS